MKIEFPNLYEIATTVLSIATSQATVERAFSILKFIFNQRRSNINFELLEKIMFLNLKK